MHWARVYVCNEPTAVEYENEYIEGFVVEECDSRSTTSANHFTIRDPRGFKFQIPAQHMMDIMRKHTIINGAIQGKFRFESDGKLRLVSETSDNIDLGTEVGIFEYTTGDNTTQTVIAGVTEINILCSDGKTITETKRRYFPVY